MGVLYLSTFSSTNYIVKLKYHKVNVYYSDENMNKMIYMFTIGILVLSGLGAVALPENENQMLELTESVSISEPIFKDTGMYLTVDLEEATSLL
ncbi:unnamed protein product, partial [marine sediment metagenome]